MALRPERPALAFGKCLAFKGTVSCRKGSVTLPDARHFAIGRPVVLSILGPAERQITPRVKARKTIKGKNYERKIGQGCWFAWITSSNKGYRFPDSRAKRHFLGMPFISCTPEYKPSTRQSSVLPGFLSYGGCRLMDKKRSGNIICRFIQGTARSRELPFEFRETRYTAPGFSLFGRTGSPEEPVTATILPFSE